MTPNTQPRLTWLQYCKQEFNKAIVKQKEEGFTLIELLLVIGIIAILAAIVILAINPTANIQSAQNTSATKQARAVQNAIVQHVIDHGAAPDGIGGTPMVLCAPGFEVVDGCEINLEDEIANQTDSEYSFISDIPVAANRDALGLPDYDSGFRVSFDGSRYTVESASAFLLQHRMFVTSASYNGDLGGLTGADSNCQALADSASLGGTWKAVLSDSTANAIDRLVITGPIYNMRPSASGGPQLLASNQADLWDGTLSSAVGYTQTGIQTSSRVWTGTQGDGTENSDHCNNWSSSEPSVICTSMSGPLCTSYAPNPAPFFNGIKGRANNTATWTQETSTLGCNTSMRLYCIDQ